MNEKPEKTVTPSSAADLARALGISRQRISAHQSKPDAPPISDVEAWREFLGEVSRNGAISPKLAEKIARQRLRVLTADAVDKERTNKIKAGQMIEFSEVQRYAIEVNSFFFGELDRMRQTYPTLFKGRTELEIFQIMDAELPNVKSGLRARIEALDKQTPEPTNRE